MLRNQFRHLLVAILAVFFIHASSNGVVAVNYNHALIGDWHMTYIYDGHFFPVQAAAAAMMIMWNQLRQGFHRDSYAGPPTVGPFALRYGNHLQISFGTTGSSTHAIPWYLVGLVADIMWQWAQAGDVGPYACSFSRGAERVWVVVEVLEAVGGGHNAIG